MRRRSLSIAAPIAAVACMLVLALYLRSGAADAPPHPPDPAVASPLASRAAVVDDLIFVAGTLGTKAGTAEIVEGGARAQAAQALRNIEETLRQTGASLSDIFKCNVYLTDMTTLAAINDAFQQLFAEPPPRTTIGAGTLALGAAVEIECIAQRPKVAVANVPIARASGFVKSGREQIYYETAGHGEAVVLCHGAGGNHVVWYQQVPVLAQSYRVITWDQRGFGRSTNRRGLAGPAASVLDLKAMLDQLGIERAHVVGQSMGGWTALSFAVAHPDRVRSLILADTIAGIYTPEIKQAVDRYLQTEATLSPPEALPLGQHPALSRHLGRQDPARAFLYQELSFFTEPPMSGRRQQEKMSFAGESLAALPFPVLFIVGSDDQIFPPVLIRQAASLVRRAQVVEISGAGHSPYFEQPQAWNDAVLSFLHAAG